MQLPVTDLGAAELKTLRAISSHSSQSLTGRCLDFAGLTTIIIASRKGVVIIRIPLMKKYIFAFAVACGSLSCVPAQAAPVSPDAAALQDQVTGSAVRVYHCRWWSGECGDGYSDYGTRRDYHSRYWSHRRRGSYGDEHSRYWSHRRFGSDNDEHSRYWSHRRRGSYWR
jgi:hypothetical protein